MTRWSNGPGRRGLLLGALVSVAPVSGWAGSPKRAPDEAKLREAEELKADYMLLYEQGKYDEAATLAERACAILGEERGTESVEIAGCLNDLAAFYGDQGTYEKAETLYERALAIRERTLGPEHPDLAESINNLAFLYNAQGRYERAEPLYERALAIHEKVLDRDHPDVGTSVNNLATLYHQRGEYGKAEALYERALAIRERTLGGDHPDVAQTINNLAVLYSDQGEYGRAEPLYEQVLAIWEKVLGPEHPRVALSINNLAMLYSVQGEYGRAELLYERALAINEKALGREHPSVATSLNNLASLCITQGRYNQAERLYERALAIREKALGRDHPHVAANLSNLAVLYLEQGAYGRAKPLHERALAIDEKTFGADHPNVATSLNNLAWLYSAQGEYDRAEARSERALAIWEKAWGPDHPNIAMSLNNLASLYGYQGSYVKAESLYQRALAIQEKALGPDHPDMATSLNNLAWLYNMRAAHDAARPLLERSLAIQEKALGPNHPDVARSLNNLAAPYYAQGAYEKAEPLLERALAIQEKALGPDHPDFAKSLINLAASYGDQGAYEKAEPLLERALAIEEKTLGPDHADVVKGLESLATLHHDRGNLDSALRLQRRALDIEETNLIRTLVIADESRRLAYASTLSASLHYVLSLHLRVNPAHDAMAELGLTTLLRRKNRVQDLVTQSNAALRRLLPDDRHLDDLVDVNSQVAVLSTRKPAKLTVEAFSRQLDELQKERDRLWSDLAEQSALVEALDHHITIEDTQGTLSAGSVLVELVRYLPQHDDTGVRMRPHEPQPAHRYAAYLIFPDRFDWVDLGPAAPIDEHVKEFRKALQTKNTIPTDLYDAVMRPIAEKLGAAHHLIIAPAGNLSLIPFGALYDGKRYLIEKYDLRYVTTGRDLLAPPATPPVTTTPITIVANPTGADLPDAELEADVLASLLPFTRVLLDEQATETNVRSIERPLILHIATHGFFGEARSARDNPMFRSGLYLADVEQVEVDRERDDGQLTAYEVSGMDLRGTQLVVLSACETGLGAAVQAEGKELMSEGVAGLRRAFAMAGARTTVMSLWKVSGVTAQTTMETYYRKLAEGMSRGEAMQAVQLEMLRSEEHAHPKDWAAFIVSGDDTPMVFPEGEEPRVAEEEPPEVEGRGGCATRSSGRGVPTGSMLIGLLGLSTHRRRRGR